MNKKAEVVRVYLPPDANCLLSVMDHCLRSRHYVNVVVAGKHPSPQWLTMDAGRDALRRGHRHLGLGRQRGRGVGRRPRRRDGLLRRRADAGDAGRRASCCASTCRELRIRVVNVVDLCRLQPHAEHPHGLSDARLRRAVHDATSR